MFFISYFLASDIEAKVFNIWRQAVQGSDNGDVAIPGSLDSALKTDTLHSGFSFLK